MKFIELLSSVSFRKHYELKLVSGMDKCNATLNHLKWRAESLLTSDNSVWAVFTNIQTLYSVVLKDDGTKTFDKFKVQLAQMTSKYNSANQIQAMEILHSPEVDQSVIASMNNIRYIIKELLEDGKPINLVNERPFKPLDWATPKEAFYNLLDNENA